MLKLRLKMCGVGRDRGNPQASCTYDLVMALPLVYSLHLHSALIYRCACCCPLYRSWHLFMVEWEKSGKTKAVKEHAAKPHKILVFATPISPKKGLEVGEICFHIKLDSVHKPGKFHVSAFMVGWGDDLSDFLEHSRTVTRQGLWQNHRRHRFRFVATYRAKMRKWHTGMRF